MSRKERTGLARTTVLARATGAIALLFAFGLSHTTRAQWTTSNGSTTTSDKVGVGTSAPSEKVHVAGRVRFGNMLFGESRTGGAEPNGEAVESFGHLVLLSTAGYEIKFGHAGLLPRMVINSAGNVGIGTTSPDTKLHIEDPGAARITFGRTVSSRKWLIGTDNSPAGLHLPYDVTAGAARIFVADGGNVGVGTASPASLLNLVGPNAALTFGAAGASDASAFSVTVAASGYYTNGGDGRGLLIKAGDSDNATGRTGGSLTLNPGAPTAPATAYGNVLLATSGGNVGVGTANPQKTLDVAGDLNATGTITGGNISAKYQDVAEWVPTSQKLQAGTVVVLDPLRSNHVLASAAPYDTSVAGVVSAQPGLILGEVGEGKVKVATMGRVRVRVDATKGAIKIGDLLVTSGTPGVAMRSEAVSLGGVTIHRPGTIIGKALEPLSGGAGEIMVLLSLQ